MSYAHQDAAVKQRLDTHLYPLKRSEKISIWSDAEIRGGDEWDESIKQQLAEADVILLLISANFNASTYIWENELNVGMARHKSGSARVIPVFLEYCVSAGLPYGKLQGYLTPDRPLSAYANENEAFTNIVKRLSADLLQPPRPKAQL